MSMNATGSLSERKCTLSTHCCKSTIQLYIALSHLKAIACTYILSMLLFIVTSKPCHIHTSLDTMPNTLTEGKWKAIYTHMKMRVRILLTIPNNMLNYAFSHSRKVQNVFVLMSCLSVTLAS
jgi:hypothetical protein